MPGYGESPTVDLDRLDQGAAGLSVDPGQVYARSFGAAIDPRPALSLLQHYVVRPLLDAEASGPDALGAPTPTISPEEANARYGVEGYLRFNQPVADDEAAFKSHMASERRFTDMLASRSNPNPLFNFGAGLAGSLVNPVNIALAAATGGVGDAALGVTGVRAALEGFGALGKVANVAAEGLATQVPFVAANAAIAAHMGEDYGAADALRDMAAGAILHTTLHGVTRAFSALRGRLDANGGGPDAAPGGEAPRAPTPGPDPVPASGVPPEVDALSTEARRGAFALAVERMANDQPVDMGELVARELEPPSLAALDERSAEPQVASFRPLAAATAITVRGTEVPVRYGLVELADLSTSHDDALNVNPAYPADLQPRARERAGAQARNHQLEAELNPKLLLNDVGAGAGAPIVGPDGVVESGNGRTIALRRSAARGGEAWGRYQAELKAQGFDTKGMAQPVLVRMRAEPMSGAQRAVLAREMNADVTERMGGTEQAMADARHLDDGLLELGERGSLTGRDFARGFIARAAPDQVGSLVDREGRLSPEGERRIRAAVLARAYEDPHLVGQVFEGEESAARQLAEGLAEAAPAWAKMRAAAARGEIPRALDVTPALNSAMELVRYARAEGVALADLVAERAGQTDMFGGDAIGPWTEAMLRLFHRDAGLTKPAARDTIAAFLRDYAAQAQKVVPGENLFGDTADETTARAIFDSAAERFRRNDPGAIDIRPPGRAAAAEPKPVVLDLRPAGDERGGAAGGVSPPGGGGAEGQGGGNGQGGARLTAEQLIAADPELKALQAATEALAADNGLTLTPAPENQNPQALADAIRAAAICMAGEL